jgi:hypothetical protein
MENRTKVRDRNGQSVAEYAVVLALIFIIAVSVLLGVGRSSRARLANVDSVLSGNPDATPASSPGDTGGAAATAGHGSENDQTADGGGGSNQTHSASAGGN